MFRQKKIFLAVSQALSLGIAATIGVSAYAQTAPATTEKTVVTGTNIRSVLEEQALPVVVITREELQKSGAVNIEQIVQQLSASASAGATTGSMLAGNATYGASTASLRGLGGPRTLVLLNGKRLTPFANVSSGFGGLTGGVDLNVIPLAAIERIEVLLDGASSIYGSDAEAGVINFITRKRFTGGEVSVEYGEPSRSGGGAVEKYSALLGFGNLREDRYNFMFSWSRKNEEALFAKDRDFSRSGNVPPFLANAATPSGRVEGIFLPGQSVNANAATSTNPFGYSGTGYGNPGRDYPGGCAAMGMYESTGLPRAGTGRNCNFDSAPFVGLFPTGRNTNVFSQFTFQLTPRTQLFAEGLWSQNVVTEAYQPSPVRIAFLQTDNAFAGSGVDPALLIFPGNPNYPSAWLQSHGLAAMDGKPLAVSARTFLTGLRTEQDTNTQRRLVLGGRGTFDKGDWVATYIHDDNSSDGKVINGYFSQLGLARLINTVGNQPGTYWNPWAVGGVQNEALTNALQSTLYVGPTAQAKTTLDEVAFQGSATLMQMAVGPMGIAFGGGYRREALKIEAAGILGLGDIAGLGGATPDTNESRHTTSAFVEVNVPITKTFETNFSGRIDHYDDLKSDKSPVTGKASFAWKPTGWMLLRGSAGRGFRAPTMGELYIPQTLGSTEQFTDPANAGDGLIQPNSHVGGNRDLKPEKSKQFSLGLSVTPTQTLSAHADYWQIQIDNFIVAPSASAQVYAELAGTFLVNPGEVVRFPDGTIDSVTQIFVNAAKANFSGFDFGAHWGDGYSFGRLGVDYNGTYYTKADMIWPTGLVEHSIGTMVDSNGNLLTLANSGVILRYKHNLALNYSNPTWGLTLVQNYYTGYRTGNRQVDDVPHYVGSFTTYDLQAQYTGIKNVKIALGDRTLFDKDPHLVIPASNFFQYGYDPAIYDPRARVYYGRLTVNF
jgi:iron complex outermembrane receptor protein